MSISLSYILKLCDFYAPSVEINYNGNYKYKTALGGICTILTIFILIYFTIFFSKDMINKTNPRLISYNKFINNKSEIENIDNSNFLVAVQLWHLENTNINLTDNDYFRITAHSVDRKILRGETSEIVPINIGKCDEKYFKSFDEIDINYKNLIMKEFVCLDLNNLSIFGNPYKSIKANYIKINFSYNLSNMLKKYGSYENMVLKQLTTLRFRTFYNSYSYSLENYDEPLKKRLSYSEVPIYLDVETRLLGSFKSGWSFNDCGYLFEDIKERRLYRIHDYKTSTFPSPYPDSKGFIDFMKLILFVEDSVQIYSRKYVKIQEVIANSLAFGKAFMLILSSLSLIYNRDRINDKLANKFFKYVPETNYSLDLIKDKKICNNVKSFSKNNLVSNYKNFFNSTSKYKDLIINDKHVSKVKEDYKNKDILSTNYLGYNTINNSIKKDNLNTKFNNNLYSNKQSSIETSSRKLNIASSNSHKFKEVDYIDINKNVIIDNTNITDINKFQDNSINVYKKVVNNKAKDLNYIKYDVINNNNINEVKSISDNSISYYEVKEPYKCNNNNTSNSIDKKDTIKKFDLQDKIKFNQGNKSKYKKRSYNINYSKAFVLENNKNSIFNANKHNKAVENLKLSFFNKVAGIICPRKTMNYMLKNKLEFYDKSRIRIKKRLDIHNILTKLDELECLKVLMLNPFQSLSMKFLKKPNICNININDPRDFYERFTSQIDDKVNVCNLIEYYKNRLKTNKFDTMDFKLLELIEPKLKKSIILSVSQDT